MCVAANHGRKLLKYPYFLGLSENTVLLFTALLWPSFSLSNCFEFFFILKGNNMLITNKNIVLRRKF